MTTRAEEIAAKEYPKSKGDNRIHPDVFRAEGFTKGYTRGQQDARSLSHPPTSELVEAARYALGFADSYQCHGHDERYRKEASQVYDKLQKALSSHPKEVAPTVEETVDELMEFLEDYIEEGIEEMHDHSSDHGWQYDRGHPNWNATMDDLRTRLTKLLTTP